MRGEVLVVGHAASTTWDAIALRRQTGYAIQDVGLFPHLTVAGNIGVVPRLLGWDRRAIDARVDELLTLVGLEPASSATAGPTSCPAASASASAWRARWPPIRRCC